MLDLGEVELEVDPEPELCRVEEEDPLVLPLPEVEGVPDPAEDELEGLVEPLDEVELGV